MTNSTSAARASKRAFLPGREIPLGREVPLGHEVGGGRDVPLGSDVLRDAPLGREAFLARLRAEGARRYHHLHPFHVAMNEGRLSRVQLQRWVINRYYYQTRIPIKDALIVAKSEDQAFRRSWLRRIIDHDGAEAIPGGLEQWLRLGEGLGVERARMQSLREVAPGVRFACDAYVNFVREASLLEAVASSLTEFFAPDLMSARLAAFEKHYPFVGAAALGYFRHRVSLARRDSNEAVEFVLDSATTRPSQEGCVRALIHKTQILWHLLDCVQWLEPKPLDSTSPSGSSHAWGSPDWSSPEWSSRGRSAPDWGAFDKSSPDEGGSSRADSRPFDESSPEGSSPEKGSPDAGTEATGGARVRS